jgi:hypothetical protein
MSDDEQLLRILEAHGKQFLESFNLSDSNFSGKRKATEPAESPSPKCARLSEDGSSSDEEWGGIQPNGGGILDEDNESDSELYTDDSGVSIFINPRTWQLKSHRSRAR